MIEPLFRDSTRSVKKLLREKRPSYTSKSGLITAVERMRDEDVIILNEPLLPSEYYSGQNFLKRGNFVQLRLEHRVDALLRAARRGTLVGPSRTRNEQFRKIPPGDYAGYAWDTLDGKELRRTLLVYCIEGSRLWDLCTREDPDATKVKRYHSHAESPRYGQSFDVEVPSFSGKGSYQFLMMHVAVDNIPEQHAAWRAMKSEGHKSGRKVNDRHEGCEFKYYIELTHRRPIVVSSCLHEIVAHRAISEWVKKEKGYIILQPYALPSQEIVELYKRLCQRTLIEEKKEGKRGLHTLHRRFLTLDELEDSLWFAVRAHRDRDLFYARTHLRTYNWA